MQSFDFIRDLLTPRTSVRDRWADRPVSNNVESQTAGRTTREQQLLRRFLQLRPQYSVRVGEGPSGNWEISDRDGPFSHYDPSANESHGHNWFEEERRNYRLGRDSEQRDTDENMRRPEVIEYRRRIRRMMR